MFIWELNKTIEGDQVRELIGHIPADVEQIVMFEVSVTHYMKIDYNGHYLALTQFGRLDSFPWAIAQLVCLQLSDKYLIKIIDMTENFNKFVLNVIHGFFLFWLFGNSNLGRIHFYIYLNTN